MDSQIFRKRQVSLLCRASLLWLEKTYCQTQALLTFHSSKYPLKTQSRHEYWTERIDVLQEQIKDMDHAYRTIDQYLQHRHDPIFIHSEQSDFKTSSRLATEHTSPWDSQLKGNEPYLYPDESIELTEKLSVNHYREERKDPELS